MDTFTHDGLTFDITDSGPSDGPVAVLLHGFPQDRTAWDGVRGRLNPAGLRTLAPDQRGYSPGARPPGRTAYTLRALRGDTLALMDAAGVERAHVVGHDWGGALAWSLAQHSPDRIASLTVLSTPHPAALAWAMRHAGQWRKSWYMGFFQLPWLPERMVARDLERLYTHHGMSPEQAAPYVARFSRPGALTGPLGWYRSMLARPKGLASSSRPSGSSAVSVPTTFVWGRHDFALGRGAAERTGEFVSADYRFIELDEDHWLPEVAPEAVSDAILTRVRSARRRTT